MDRAKLVGELYRKHRIPLDVDDPVLLIGEVAEVVLEAYLKQARESLTKDLTECLDQMEAHLVGAEQSAKANAESVVTQGAVWLRAQFETVTAEVVERFRVQVEEGKKAAHLARTSAAVSAVVASLSVVALVVDLITR